LGGATASTLGDGVSFFAISWIAASHGPGVASLVLTVESVPLCLFILAGGAVADHWGVRRVMIGCDAFMALVMGAFAIGALVAVPVWGLVAVAALGGTASALRRPAAGVFPRLFARGDEELSRTMATSTLCQQLAQIVGPSVGEMLLAAGGLSMTSAVDSGSFVLVLCVLAAVRPPYEEAPAAGDAEPMWRQMRQSVVAARRLPGGPATVAAVVGLAVTILPLVSLCVPLAGHGRGWSAGATGMVSGAWVVGGLLVMTVVARRGMFGRRVSLAGPAVAAAGVLALASSQGVPAAAAALMLVGAGTSMLTTRLFPRFVDAAPPAMLARLYSVLGLAQSAPMLVATPLLGWLVGVVGLRAVMLVLAAILVATAAAARRADARLGGAGQSSSRARSRAAAPPDSPPAAR